MKHGDFCWYELYSDDLDASKAFYETLVGWRVEDSGMPGQDYWLAKAGDTAAAGMMRLPPEAKAAGARPGWSGVVAVDDADDAAQRIVELGGRVHHGPQDIPGVGRFASATDPQGAPFTILRGEGGGAAPVRPGEAGHVGWRELYAKDWEPAFTFYAALFGWKKAEAMDMGPMGTYQMFSHGAEAIGGMMTAPQPMPPAWIYYIAVEEFDAGMARANAAGATVVFGPQEVPGGVFIFHGVDPTGVAFAVVGPRKG